MLNLNYMNRVGNTQRMQLLTGRAHPELAAEIAEKLGVELCDAQISDFANGEISIRFNESLRGNDVFIIQTHGAKALKIHTSIFEQLLMIDAAKRASARSITAVCPLLSYARQDRKAAGREPIAARLIVDMLSAAGADRIMSIDLHSGQTQGFFDGPFDHLIAMPLFKKYIKANLDSDIMFVAPDAGRVKMAERYSSAFSSGVAIVHKTRSTDKHNTVKAKELIGDVKGKDCVVVDDMIDTAGTFCATAEILRERGAKDIYGLATHGVLSEPSLKRIEESSFKKVILTNTVPINTRGITKKIEVLSVAKHLADAISAVNDARSVSALFEGQNQL